jgi:hypothetical protein
MKSNFYKYANFIESSLVQCKQRHSAHFIHGNREHHSVYGRCDIRFFSPFIRTSFHEQRHFEDKMSISPTYYEQLFHAKVFCTCSLASCLIRSKATLKLLVKLLVKIFIDKVVKLLLKL